MTPYYADDLVTLYHGDCLDVLASLPDASVDAVVTDPPYGLANTDPEQVAETITRWTNGERDYLPGGAGFMGKAWDAFVPPVAVWDDCLRVLKPGGHLLAFAGSRTVDLMTLGLRLAGFEIRDSIAWLYGSGFPKSLDVSKAIDRQRHDANDKLRVTTWLADTAERNGVTRADVDAHMGTSDMGGWWLSRLRHRCAIPTLDQVPRLLDVLGVFIEDVPDEIRALLIDLNGMKGQPGPAWFARPITQAEVRPLVSGEHISFDQRSSKERERRDIPATPDAERWQGWGTALKPAFEPVVVARKPLAGTVAANVLAHGTGALNIDGCRVAFRCEDDRWKPEHHRSSTAPHPMDWGSDNGKRESDPSTGRWPANVILDETQAAALDEQSGELTSGANPTRRGSDKFRDAYGDFAGQEECIAHRGADSGGASRFFYVAKADASERVRVNGTAHPTVKPLALMRWLVRLVTPPGGTVLEPFAGSGTTVEACILEGFRCIAIEREADYLPLIRQRINRRRDPVEAVKATSEDRGLFDLLGEVGA